MNPRTGTARRLSQGQARPHRRRAPRPMDDEAMAAAKPTKNKPAEDTPRLEHGERDILLTMALVGAGEFCALAWVFH